MSSDPLGIQEASSRQIARQTNIKHDEVVCDTRLLDVSEERVRKVIGNFPARELTSVVLAYALAQAGSKELFAVLQKACIERCRQFPMEQIASLLWSFATIRLGPSLFREIQFDILERLSQLSVPAVCDILWSYCAVQHYDPHFFKVLLSTLVPSRVAGDPRCALLCPALLDIRARFPEMDPEGLERYMGYARDEFHSYQISRAPSAAVMESVATALDSLGLQHELMVDVDGYVVDAVASSRSKDGFHGPLAVLCHSAKRTLHSRTNEPLGLTMMRQRHLRGRNYLCVNLLELSWNALNISEQVSLLKMKLSDAQQRCTYPGVDRRAACRDQATAEKGVASAV